MQHLQVQQVNDMIVILNKGLLAVWSSYFRSLRILPNLIEDMIFSIRFRVSFLKYKVKNVILLYVIILPGNFWPPFPTTMATTGKR